MITQAEKDLLDRVEIPFDADAPAPDWEEVFGRAAPLAVEIGSGNGVFMAREAAEHPETNFIAIERAGEFFVKCAKRVAREGHANVRCMRADAWDVFARWIAPGSVSRIIANFSDPWPKRRHRDRRVFGGEFLKRIEGVLEAEGRLEFRTDVGWYFNFTVSELRRRGGWRFDSIGPIESDAGTETNFARKARESGDRVWGFVARWQGRGAA